MEFSNSKYAKFLAAIELYLKRIKFKSWLTSIDIAHNIISEHEDAPVDDLISYIPEYVKIAKNKERTANLDDTSLHSKKQFSKHWIAKEKAENPGYIQKCRNRNNTWQKNEYKKKSVWSRMRNAAKKIIRAVYNKIRKSKKPQRCPLHKGKCIRLSHKNHTHPGTTCPLPHKFLLEDGMCFPIKHAKSIKKAGQ